MCVIVLLDYQFYMSYMYYILAYCDVYSERMCLLWGDTKPTINNLDLI